MRIQHNTEHYVSTPPCPYCEKRIPLMRYYREDSVHSRCGVHLRLDCTQVGKENQYSFMRRTGEWEAACYATCVAARPKKVKLAKRKGAAA